MVEGEEHGVFFRVFSKRMDCAERIAIEVRGAVVTCLYTLERRRWMHDEWVIVA
jgi:hypothetical protein